MLEPIYASDSSGRTIRTLSETTSSQRTTRGPGSPPARWMRLPANRKVWSTRSGRARRISHAETAPRQASSGAKISPVANAAGSDETSATTATGTSTIADGSMIQPSVRDRWCAGE